MCVVSNIGDTLYYNPLVGPAPYNGPTKDQFEEFLKLMRQAKKLDKAMGAADCEDAAKVAWLKGLADCLGCDVSDFVP